MKVKKNIIIFGSSGQAKVIVDIIEKQNEFNIIGLIDDFKDKGELFLGYEILGKSKNLPKLISKYKVDAGIIAIGDNWTRGNVAEEVRRIAPNFKFASVIHPSAQIGNDVSIGNGTVVVAGAIINSGSTVGAHCIINTNSSIDHDCKIANFASIAPGATLAGHVNLGSYSAVCVGANVINDLSVGEHTIIGSGATVVTDILDYVVALGTPARAIRKRKAGDKYL